ncbi:transcriptional corepressor LEUNIG-like isoform X3 [Lotus japonicus]|uniref:transcriptional corepressor LEUNIG-like isoform X3 n=1 Tax=Lotus japonicus TaxID=34305 RepID=UPI002584B9CD|nr:transcriptional corepressor LEUNIG-like isoform X3 [Lotus japonicus]
MASSNDPKEVFDADAMFQLYLHDYMIKRGMRNTAEIFRNEAQFQIQPLDMKYFDSVLDSPDGFLYDWWSIFYEVFASRYGRGHCTGPESSCKVPMNMMPAGNSNNASPHRIPQIPMNEHRPQQFQANSGFNNMIPQPAARLIPQAVFDNGQLGNLAENVEPSLHDLLRENNQKLLSGTNSNHLPHPQDVGKQVQKYVFKGSGVTMRVGRDVPRDPPDVVQKTMLPLDGPHQTNNNEALNLVPQPLNGGPVNTPNSHQQCQVLKTQNQDAALTQAPACTPNRQTSTVPGTKRKNKHPKIPKTGSSKNDSQKMEQIISTGEHQCNQDQQIQMQSQNVESTKRMITESTRPVESAQDCADAKPADENVESFLSFEDEPADNRIEPFSNLKRISATCSRNENKGFSLQEIGCLHKSINKVLTCHFSSDGKVMASAGHEKKVFIWNMENFQYFASADTHSHLITDVRFQPGSTMFATSSFDRSVRLWDASNPIRSLGILTGHDEQVMSLDFHPRRMDLLCSSDSNDVIRLWNVNQSECMHTTRGGSKQVRFQPQYGQLLATAIGNSITIIDVETDSHLHDLKGHDKDVLSICWDRSGNFLASVSEDSARIWSAASDGKCIGELHSVGNKFQSCIFHPGYRSLLIIGGYQSLEAWSPTEGSKTWSIAAHQGLIAGLADSPVGELIASASHDNSVKVWK